MKKLLLCRNLVSRGMPRLNTWREREKQVAQLQTMNFKKVIYLSRPQGVNSSPSQGQEPL